MSVLTYVIDCAQCIAERALAASVPDANRGHETAYLCGVYQATLEGIACRRNFRKCSRHRRGL